MTSFFNKKEEVIELRLSEYGKYLLSQGVLRPVHYAFFDNDVLYDPEYGNFVESQNNGDNRIKLDTPSMKALPNITSVESRVGKFLEAVREDLASDPNLSSVANPNIAHIFAQQQAFEEKINFLNNPLGRSSLNSSKLPAWSVSVLANRISASAATVEVRTQSRPEGTTNPSGFETVPGVVQQIPQMDIIIDYETFFREGEFTSDAIQTEYINGDVFLALTPDYLVLDVLEENTSYEKENFDIEVFHSGSEEYAQMSFVTGFRSEALQPLTAESSIANVGYYMNIYVDGELPPEVTEDLNLRDNPFSRADRLNFNRDLYFTPVDENEEPCD